MLDLRAGTKPRLLCGDCREKADLGWLLWDGVRLPVDAALVALVTARRGLLIAKGIWPFADNPEFPGSSSRQKR